MGAVIEASNNFDILVIWNVTSVSLLILLNSLYVRTNPAHPFLPAAHFLWKMKMNGEMGLMCGKSLSVCVFVWDGKELWNPKQKACPSKKAYVL